jgi:prepilin-type N-terminal cleavage/methylation domain-containing protein
MKNQSGLSLVELITTVAVLATLSLASYPAMESWQHKEKVRAEIRHLVSTLMNAKIEAIKENRYVVVQFSGSGYKAFVDDGANGGTAKDWICQPGEREFVNHSNIDGLLLNSNFPSDRMRFRGRVGIRAGSVYFSSGEKDIAKVVLSVTGRVRVEKL